MESAQAKANAKYKNSEKGRQKQVEAQQRYLESTESWQSFVPLELSDRVKAVMPKGMSKSQFLKQLLEDFLEKSTPTH